MLKKITIILIVLLIPIKTVNANETEDTLNELSEEISNLKNKINNLNLLDDKYPIGSIYITKSDVNPSEILGGTWEAFGQGRTLVGVDDTSDEYSSSELIGGNNKITLNSNNLPAHTHTFTPQGTIASTFKGTSTETSSSGSHTHSIKVAQTDSEAQSHGLEANDDGFAGRIIVRTSKNSYTNSTGNHTHKITPSGSIDSIFSGSDIQTSSTGATQSFSVQNPYITVYFWKRTK